MEKNLNRPKIIRNQEGLFQLIDDDQGTLKTRLAQRCLKIYDSYFLDTEKRTFKPNLTYVQLLELIKNLNHRLEQKGLPQVATSQKFDRFIQQKRYFIKQQSEAGLTIKAEDTRWAKEFSIFKQIVKKEITRPLLPQQEKASFFLAIMKRAANFSVPGAGKTAMMYGTFAFLSSSAIKKVNRLLIISPINAFSAWRTEFVEVFDSKRRLQYMNLREKKYNDNQGEIIHDWINSNVITINYESLKNKLLVLNKLIDNKTMVVFDEVHRVKGINGERAQAALNLSRASLYRYVLTGTPIPNGFQDIYNFLHLMYPDEYTSFFAWDVNELKYVDPEDVNQKLAPFFWRTNKQDLKVPAPEPDIKIEVEPSAKQKNLAESIYDNERNALARFVRLLQASTNPELLEYKINYNELGLIEVDSPSWDHYSSSVKKDGISDKESYKELSLNEVESPKFNVGIALIEKLVKQGKKVLVWGIFVKTMRKIKKYLEKDGINVILIYGRTPKNEREGQIEKFRNGSVQVLITNPNTLGESISLHQTVHDAVYFEYNFNLTFMLQSRDRINRLGLPQNQYTRYYYLMSKGDAAHSSFIDEMVYKKLKEKEQVMLKAIEGKMLIPEYADDYLEEVKKIVMQK